MKTTLVIWVLRLLLSVTAEQWRQVFGWVTEAAARFTEGRTKNAWVRENIAKMWPSMKPHVVDALVGLAVGVLKKGAKP